MLPKGKLSLSLFSPTAWPGHLPSSKQIQTQIHPSKKSGVSLDSSLLYSKYMKSFSINKYIIWGDEDLWTSTKLAMISFITSSSNQNRGLWSISGDKLQSLPLVHDGAGLWGQESPARTKGSKANVGAKTTVQRLQVSGLKIKPRGSESWNF